MKILYRTLQLSLILLFVGLFTSCNKAKDETPNADSPKSDATAMLNIRYIDKDSLLHNYNLAKDLSEAMLRTSDNYENIQRQKANEIQKFAAKDNLRVRILLEVFISSALLSSIIFPSNCLVHR